MIGSRLAHYSITGKIGEGGMGEVYRATDTRLGRAVALKLLPVEVSNDPERLARFRREATALAALDHPNIVTVHSVEEAEGRYFLTMGLVEGQTIDRVQPTGGFGVDELLSIALPLVDAVAAAHEKHIVHRDLKPANIMLMPDRRLKVLDFGLAKLEETPGSPITAATDTLVDLTEEGMVVGTAPYMSPEQLRGAPVDHRTDIFSLGVVLYELATGRRPFSADSAADLAVAILKDTPAPPSRLKKGLPPAFDGVVLGCLEKEPAARVQTARALFDALAALRDGSPAPSSGLAIAVLPFKDMSPQRDQDYFCEGMAEEIMNALVQVPGLRVASRASAFRAAQENMDPATIARTLDVDHVLEGSVRTAGSRMRVTARLVDTRTGYQAWSERYDRETVDVFAVQDEIATGVVVAVEAQLIAANPAAPQAPSVRQRERVKDLDVYRLYLKARRLRYTLNDHRGALAVFREVVARDPGHGEAWGGRADAACLTAWYQLRPADAALAETRAALATAESLQGEFAQGWFIRGLLACSEFDWAGSGVPFRRAIELDPGHVQTWSWLGVSEAMLGREDAALAALARARELDPLAPYPYGMTGHALLCLHRTDEVEPYARQALEFEADHTLARLCLGIALIHQDRCEEAIETLQRAVDLTRRAPHFVGVLGWALAHAGRTDAARELLSELNARTPTDEGPPPTLVSEAFMRAALGETDAAWAVIERARSEGQPMAAFTVIANLEAFHADPRWPAYARAVGIG